VLLDADAVHLGEASVDPADAKRLVPPDVWLSRACHDPEDAAEGLADAVIVSPVMESRKGRPPLGPAALTAAKGALERAGRTATHVYALGGVDASSAPTCVMHGAHGVAVVGAVLDGRDPEPLLLALGIHADPNAGD
jgi:thiamine monophosphate synthase